MSKVLVEIYLPAADKKYDVFIPLDSAMSNVTVLVGTVLSDLSDGKFKMSEDSLLCDAESGLIYNINMSVADLGIKNGAKLILI